MTAHLPPHLLALFAPRPPIPFLPPPEPKNPLPYVGLADYVKEFEEPTATTTTATSTPATTQVTAPQGVLPFDNKKTRQLRRTKEKLLKHQEKLDELLKLWDPHSSAQATGDPYKTIFVGRLNFNTSDHKLKREFEMYGHVKSARVVADKEGKSRGYGFVEFERERDMRTAYKQADGKKIDGKRIVVDVERGRTVRNWKPRRLGGGLGFTRLGGKDVNQKYSGREPPVSTKGTDREDKRDRDRDRDRDRSSRRDRDYDRDKDRERDRDRRR